MKRLTYFICMNRKVSPHEQCCVNYGVSTGCLDLCRKRANSRSRSTFPRNTKCEKYKHAINMCWHKGMCKIVSKWSKWATCLNIQDTLVYSWNQSLLSSGCTKVDRPCNPKRHPTSSQCCKGLYCQAYGPNINPGGRCQYPRIQPEPRILSTHRGTKSK